MRAFSQTLASCVLALLSTACGAEDNPTLDDSNCLTAECLVEDGATGGSGGTPSASGGNLNTASGGAGTGASTSSGGDATSGSGGKDAGSGGSTSETSTLAASYPCDGSSADYDVVMTGSGSDWTVTGGGQGSETFMTANGGMDAALAEAYSRLAGSASDKDTLLIQGSGTISADAQIKMPSYMVLNLCGTIEVIGSPTKSDRAPLYARDRSDIDIPHATITGNPQYGMFFRNVPNVHLGEIELSFNKATSGEGVRYDNNPAAGGPRVKNFTIDSISVTNTGGHGVETYGAEEINIGTFVGEGTHYCGLILNNSINAVVDSVSCQDCADPGTGYAAFRVANSNGNDGGTFPSGTIYVGSVYARGGDRGIFSVSGSGGLIVEKFDLGGTSGTPILLQNCYNTILGATQGLVAGGQVRISNDTTNTNNGTYPKTSGTIIKNTTLSGGANVLEDWCDSTDRGNRAENVSGGTVSMCHP